MSTVNRVAPRNDVDSSAPWQPCSIHGQHWSRVCVECGDQAVAHLADTLRGKLAVADRANAWKSQCLQDLAAGRHAVGCECEWSTSYESVREIGAPAEKMTQRDYQANACLSIVRCALEMRDYECEVGDAEAAAGRKDPL